MPMTRTITVLLEVEEVRCRRCGRLDALRPLEVNLYGAPSNGRYPIDRFKCALPEGWRAFAFTANGVTGVNVGGDEGLDSDVAWPHCGKCVGAIIDTLKKILDARTNIDALKKILDGDGAR